MKKIYIYMSLDGDMYFARPKTLYNYAIRFDSKAPAYSTFLKKLRNENRDTQLFNNGADARIDFLR